MLMKWMIAGGGTGGHLFPGLALAEEVCTRHPDNEVLFVGTARGLETTIVPREGYRLELIDIQGLKGKGVVGLLRGLLRIPRAMFQAYKLLKKEKPQIVIGVGGYASGPVVLMAALMGFRTAVQEQNALPGFTNKVLGRFVDAVFVAFPEAVPFFAKRKTHLIGNPIRRALLDNFLKPKIASSRFTLLVTGGSQGAHRLNLRVVEAMEELGPLAKEFTIVHQTGVKDRDEVEKRYRELGLEAEVTDFIKEMPKAYARADLIVCRAGAATLAEITVARKAAILVPFPFAADDHQTVNANSLVDAGAALMFQESALDRHKLAAAIRELHGDPDRRLKMERAAGLLGRPEAAREIADVCVEMVVPMANQGRKNV
jgi:UDP-N-acetylglucosamine--N-acetylmuramyl-(pentapeptide) pyrophosphoryl-undecaprenol N-acetylglucosamine transferase